MKEITSKKTKHTQVISDESWMWLVANGRDNRYTVVDIPEKIIKKPNLDTEEIIQPKITRTPKTEKKDD
jgi:hypothetical protein